MSNLIEQILEMADILPSGLNDAKAADKLLVERDEYLQARQHGDEIDMMLEVADNGYYAIKHLDWVARQLDMSIEDVLEMVIVKYSLRAQPSNPKDAFVERLVMEQKWRKMND
jgi:phosphoribosyl-ATP pyrophosphohydrolase